jgi:hypothetical protein
MFRQLCIFQGNYVDSSELQDLYGVKTGVNIRWEARSVDRPLLSEDEIAKEVLEALRRERIPRLLINRFGTDCFTFHNIVLCGMLFFRSTIAIEN